MESKQKYLEENEKIYIGVTDTVKEGLLSIAPNKEIRESIYDAVKASHFLDMEVEDKKLMSFLMKGDSYDDDEYYGILADTPVKLMQKIHQMCSGTVKFEDGSSRVLNYNKAEYIRDYFKGKKVGIFYKFKEELNALKHVFGDSICTTLEEFNGSNKNIALQIVSGREGISLREAECLVFYNIDFSATSYWQARDRMTTKDRLKNDVYWIFSDGGIESSIYDSVKSKKDFTLNHFRRQLF